jgi:hypothetical protein
VRYSVFSDAACSAGKVDAGAMQVTNGVIANSSSTQFMIPGTYYWQAVYFADNNNSAATSTCGSEVLTVNATTSPTTTPLISGTVFNDANHNKKMDSGEKGLGGWTINLFSQNGWKGHKKIVPFMSTITDSNGNYSFSNVPAGMYQIFEVQQDHWKSTTPHSKDIKVTASSIVVNFGNIHERDKSHKDHNEDDNN